MEFFTVTILVDNLESSTGAPDEYLIADDRFNTAIFKEDAKGYAVDLTDHNFVCLESD
jgi:hypothetical protein